LSELVMAAGNSIINERRLHSAHRFTLPQSAVIIADWAAKNGHQEGGVDRVRLGAARMRREVVHRAPDGQTAAQCRRIDQ